jgi:hypothetical protein
LQILWIWTARLRISSPTPHFQLVSLTNLQLQLQFGNIWEQLASNFSQRLPPVGRGQGLASGTLLASFVEALGALRERLNADGLTVIGGETAYQLLRRMGARHLDIFEQRAEVIATSRIAGGVLDGCRFVSKGGSVRSLTAGF